jgi:hypothetical protein
MYSWIYVNIIFDSFCHAFESIRAETKVTVFARRSGDFASFFMSLSFTLVPLSSSLCCGGGGGGGGDPSCHDAFSFSSLVHYVMWQNALIPQRYFLLNPFSSPFLSLSRSSSWEWKAAAAAAAAAAAFSIYTFSSRWIFDVASLLEIWSPTQPPLQRPPSFLPSFFFS